MDKKTEILISPKQAFQVIKSVPSLAKNFQVLNDSKLTSNAAKIKTNSQDVSEGDIFIAYRGNRTDSHIFISEVISKNPSMIIVENPRYLETKTNTPIICVTNSRETWSYLCAHSFGNPQDDLFFLGVTGTNGKTSSIWILRQLFLAENIPCLSIGTLGIYLGNEEFQHSHTTPDPPVFFKYLDLARAKDIKIVIMEVSSHSIVQKKLSPIKFHGLSWTSFSRDHLDFHKSMENYWEAKWSIFRNQIKPGGKAFLNNKINPSPPIDLIPADVMFYEFRTPKTTMINSPSATIDTEISHTEGTQINIQIPNTKGLRGKIPYWGQFNLENFLNACLLFLHATNRLPQVTSFHKLQHVPGRLQRVGFDQQRKTPTVIIDYAHTPDALEKALKALRPYCKGQLYVVFGCGGERDKGKRPKMAAVAEKLSDFIFLTSDNPRGEDPLSILKDIELGFSTKHAVMIEINRRIAIEMALRKARVDDFLLIAGKGHEAYQMIGTSKFDFDDYKISQSILKTLEESAP